VLSFMASEIPLSGAAHTNPPEPGDSEDNTSIRVLLLQDPGFMRAGLRSLLEQHGKFSVVGEAACQMEASQLCRTASPDLILIDFSSPQLNAIAAITEIRRDHPQIGVVALSADGGKDLVIRAFRSGAGAFVLMRVSDSDLLEAMDAVSNGRSYLSVDLYQQVFHAIQNNNGDFDDRDKKLGKLSPREWDVLRLVALGQSTKEVATSLGLTVETVRTYRKTMMKKLGVTNVALVTAFAIANGVIDTENANWR
jgi:DNA-binding NarL/FixJ family response regulator